jgi:hypothetical protein
LIAETPQTKVECSLKVGFALAQSHETVLTSETQLEFAQGPSIAILAMLNK